MKLDIKDLMVGDWVICKDYPMTDEPRRIKPEHFLRSLVEFEAIPLTPEILAHNNFERQELGGGVVVMWTGYGEDNAGDIEVEFRPDGEIFVKIDVMGVYMRTDCIEYVHSLQHEFHAFNINIDIEKL